MKDYGKLILPIILVLLLFVTVSNTLKNPMQENKTKILYFYDALCGWCYGFSPVMTEIRQNYGDKFDFEIVSGGLKLESGVGPIGEVAPYIKAGAYKTVEERCGVKFGEDFINGPLEEGNMIMNSFPPAVALSIVKEKMPDRAFEFGSMLHRAVYVDGMHPEHLQDYGRYAEKIGLDGTQFVKDLSDPKYQNAALQDISLTKNYGISGFPTLVVIKDEKASLLSNGYVEYEYLEARLDTLQ